MDEFEDISFLSATLAWDDSSICTFTEAVNKFELSFDQVDKVLAYYVHACSLSFLPDEEAETIICFHVSIAMCNVKY